MKVNILRQKTNKSEPYMESFLYDGPEDNTVAGLLEYLNYNDDIMTIEGQKTTRISWSCSCIQGICGACAMIINDKPALACETFLKDLNADELTIRPLTKFPVICDLIVDRSSIHENLRKNNVFIGKYQPPENKDAKYEDQYNAAKCLKCGLCLEICPKYRDGGDFFGAAFANDCFLVASRSGKRKDQIVEAYDEHFKNECAYDLACANICPMGIKMTASMAMLNRMKR